MAPPHHPTAPAARTTAQAFPTSTSWHHEPIKRSFLPPTHGPVLLRTPLQWMITTEEEISAFNLILGLGCGRWKIVRTAHGHACHV